MIMRVGKVAIPLNLRSGAAARLRITASTTFVVDGCVEHDIGFCHLVNDNGQIGHNHGLGLVGKRSRRH